MPETAQEGRVPAIRKQAHGFDVIGMNGGRCNVYATVCRSHLATGGIIIHKSRWHCRACDTLRDKGYFQVGFSGISPANWYATTNPLSPGCP